MAGRPFWETKAPEGAEKKHLSKKEVQTAKAKARAAGRPYPNLVDNVAAVRAGKKDR